MPRRRLIGVKSAAPALAAAALLVLLAGCAATPSDEVTWTVHDWGTEFAGNSEAGPAFDYQLGGGYEPPAGAVLVVRDRTDEPAPGLQTICYVNAFQSQPGEADLWLDEHPDLILRGADGEPVIDENWPDEMLFDTSTEANRAELAEVIGGWIDGCAADGFLGVEFDNLDSFLRSRGALTDADNFALAATLVERVHGKNMAAGQKNAAEFAEQGSSEIGFDFAITEECYRWNECFAYMEAYGANVYNIEYVDDLRGSVEETCTDIGAIPPATIFRDRDLVTPDDPAYHLEWC